jgi:hypothetical protein
MDKIKEKIGNEMESCRREVLKRVGKSALFVIPTIMTFKAADLHALPSEPTILSGKK